MEQSSSLLTVDDVARQLALKPCTIRKWIFQRRMPVVRIGRAVRIRQMDVEALILNGLNESVAVNS
jgi:excisionase family DNA binding protein